ncbi:Protein FAR1-RELATED SEQUENCE 5 [Glycine soja]|uniref:Protein FAR1-RELATED SEQUENCE n=1 Tax=Glycine soja TaxID=3848 RepID=A0A445HR70_GLYSO|nr:Protein FAR1-RELATED SEQUENCE 5 [Glycine soja]
MLYVLYTEDKGSRLQRLFWCDTESQLLYEVFGDVLAFDATYKKNKYLCPFLFSLLLEQLLVAMKGKAPCSIITDGDLAMRNAITRVMSGVFHRLCAWHLLRNALSHVRDKQVLKWLKNLRLGDFEVVEFDEKWKEMVSTFELEGNTWIAELCLTYFRYRVVMADYSSTYENEVLQLNLRSLERSGDHLLTKEMLKLFQSYLCRTIKLRVVDCKEMATFSIYTILNCMRMQSISLPCDHILVVLVSLNFMELPSSLVLNRWSKVAIENIKDKYLNFAMYWDSQLMARYATLVEVSRQVCEAAYHDEDEYDKMLHFLSNEVRRLKSKNNSEPCIDDNDEQED